jgi:hypothetical protein
MASPYPKGTEEKSVSPLRTLIWLLAGMLPGLLGLPRCASADVVLFSDLGAGNSYDNSQSSFVFGPTTAAEQIPGLPARSQFLAVSFETGPGYDLSQILIALGNVGGTNGALVTLNQGLNCLLESTCKPDPNGVIESWNVAGLPGSSQSTISAAQTLTSTPGLHLSAGTYWVVVAPLASDSDDRWFYDLGPLSGLNTNTLGAFSQDGQLWTTGVTNTGIEITGTPTTVSAVPEPSSLSLLVSLLLALGFIRPRLAHE